MILTLVNFYLLMHLMATVAGIVGSVLRFFIQKNILKIKSASELKLNYFFLGLCFCLPLIAFIPGESFQFEPVAKIEAARSFQEFDSSRISVGQPVLLLSEALPQMTVSHIFPVSVFFVLLSLMLGLGKMAVDLGKLAQILKNSILIRRIGRLKISVSDHIQVPFSAKILNSWVVIPTDFLAVPEKYRISVLHEIQHHRQRDTTSIYFLLILKSLLLLNPVMWIWGKAISEVQEIACDENLVDQGKVTRKEYASRLIEIAETAFHRKEQLVCAAGLAFLNDRHSISRRIESMFHQGRRKSMIAQIIGASVTLTLTVTAFAAREIVMDHRVSMAEAQKMVEVAKKDSDFPIVMNDLVLKQLNRYLGTAEGRSFIKESMERLEQYRPTIEAKLKQYDMPEEIIAIGVVESGYKNLPQPENKYWGAGIWMFIKSTAIKYGLRVDSVIDERLNVEAETDAAMRYLSSNQLRFKDWLLAIQAYNTGENRVQTAIDKQSTRDVWALLKAGLPSDKDYLARVMAVVLILKNPSALEL